MGQYLVHTIKNRILEGNPFDGSGIDFSNALKELRKQGYLIKYNRKTGMYKCHGLKLNVKAT
jgi:hypothetical protein